MQHSEEIPDHKPQKTKRVTTQTANFQTKSKKNVPKTVQSSLPPKAATKRAAPARNEASPVGQQPERSNSDSLPESSSSGNEYRALRRKYLLLEEESFSLGTNLREVEDEVKSLEDEKMTLLDKLVVLEGLIDPSELQNLSQGKI